MSWSHVLVLFALGGGAVVLALAIDLALSR